MEASRVAEIIAELPDGTAERGSGYRTGTTAVLTAAHVVEDATRVRVRFDADTDSEWATVANSWRADADSDIAVLSIDPREDELPPAKFGRIGDGDAVLPATAVGFPLWKLKNYDGTVHTGRYRDTHQANGMVAVLSNRREGTLEFTVTPPGDATDPEPWEGMSGAALWISDRIVGVIARHHRADGLGRLTAVRLAPELLGITEPLPDVIRPPEAELILTDYRNQVAAIAPETLFDREDELAELTRFAAGDEPYAWWQAGPWAGKTALMSWFVLHPPQGVDVVSFFVTGRLAAQDDSDAFTTQVTLQLAALTGRHLPDVLTLDGRQNQLWRLLEEAARRRLVIVIDGLDEDAGPGHGKPSIAALLPIRPPPNVRILIASRPGPQVPDDVLDEDHPLLTCPRRQLTESPHARSIQRRATNELNRHLRGDDLHRDVLGLITASGGGLTRGDLEELTVQPRYELDRLLDGLLGRTIGSRPAPLRPENNEPVHLFTHETLAHTARAKFGSSLRTYQARIHTWADTHREKGWPQDTPHYLLLGYPNMLVDAGDHDRLVAVATDQARHDRMLEATGGDALATSEIRLTQDILCRQPSPDLSALLLLAAHDEQLARRNSAIPVRLPLVWMMLGDTARAEALARGITNPEDRAHSLVALVEYAARTGDHERHDALVADVRTLARHITASYSRQEVLKELAAASGQPDLVFSIAHDVDGSARDALLVRVAESAAAQGDHALALRFGSSITDVHSQAQVLGQLARTADQDDQAWSFLDAITDPGDRRYWVGEFVRDTVAADGVEQARVFLGFITDRDTRAWATAAMAEAVAATGDYEQASTLAESAVRMASSALDAGEHDPLTALYAEAWTRAVGIADQHDRTQAAIAVARAVARGSVLDIAHTLLVDARKIVWVIDEVADRADFLQGLARTAASAGDHDQARALLADAEQLVDQITDEEQRDQARAWLLRSGIAADAHDWALARVGDVADRHARAMVMAEAAGREGGSQLLTDAEALLRTLDDPDILVEALGSLAKAAARCGDHERALALVNDIPDAFDRDVALSNLAEDAAEAGDYERARELVSNITTFASVEFAKGTLVEVAKAAHAWDLAAAIIRDRASGQAFALAELAVAIAEAGDPDRAWTLARDTGSPDQLPKVLTQLAEVAATAGDLARARALLTEAGGFARALSGFERSHVLAEVVEVAVTVGEHDQALGLAHDIAHAYGRARAFAHLAEAFAEADDHSTAGELVVEAEALARKVEPPADAITGLAVASLVAGEQDRARRLAHSEPYVDARAEALARLAVVASAGDPAQARSFLTEAVATADGLRDAHARARRLTQLVGVADTVGRRDLTLSIIAGAEAALAAVTEVAPHADLLIRLARAVMATGDKDTARIVLAEAETMASTVTDPDARGSIYAGIAMSVIAAGDYERARILADRITDFYKRHDVLEELAVHATVTGDHELARSVALSTSNRPRQAEMLAWLVQFATVTGDHERASSLVEDIADATRRAEMSAWLARPATLRGLYSKIQPVAPLVDLLIAAGNRELALSVVRDITEDVSQAPELTKLVDAEIAAGDRDRALAIAREIRVPSTRVRALSRVAEALVAAGDLAPARSMLVEVLVHGPWYESVEVMAKVAPDELIPVLDQLEARCKP